jgi:hypothetical protein
MLNPDQIPERWGDIAADYEAAFEGLSSQFARDVLRLLDLKAGERVIDVAAGTGAFSLLAARAGADVLATDFAAGMVAHLRTIAGGSNRRLRRERLGAWPHLLPGHRQRPRGASPRRQAGRTMRHRVLGRSPHPDTHDGHGAGDSAGGSGLSTSCRAARVGAPRWSAVGHRAHAARRVPGRPDHEIDRPPARGVAEGVLVQLHANRAAAGVPLPAIGPGTHRGCRQGVHLDPSRLVAGCPSIASDRSLHRNRARMKRV